MAAKHMLWNDTSSTYVLGSLPDVDAPGMLSAMDSIQEIHRQHNQRKGGRR